MADKPKNDSWLDRRSLLVATGGAMAWGAASEGVARAAAPSQAPVPSLVPVFTAYVTLSPPIEYGVSNGVKRRLIPITGGTFVGDRIKGAILPGGGDWQDVAADGSAQIFARYSLRADDGTIIGVSNPGIRNGPPEVLRKLAAGEVVDPSLYYFRTTPTFTVEDGPHDWLRKSLFICSGIRRANDVEIVYYVVT
ncbi:DUF3237 domain-containing protein [Sphingobium lactosutens]|uniref:UPF0311 protein RLDS_27270 n=1 Tax=Sphingobium lactosutens DS20 TaxID=1331060 RepID=T0IG69_9SPHN|nr:DUF3237 family protein [Sphingobium lactosutens]EQB10685.1 hypothetical protein RLDS_27270 [Sphingobium lactosutens DS20]